MQLPVAFSDDCSCSASLATSPAGGGAGLAAAAVAQRRRRGAVNRREQMAVMEAALGSSLSHPNILQASGFGGNCWFSEPYIEDGPFLYNCKHVMAVTVLELCS
jgi:hypothetical protein